MIREFYLTQNVVVSVDGTSTHRILHTDNVHCVHCERSLDFGARHPMFVLVLEVFRMNEMDDRVRDVYMYIVHMNDKSI